jgi:uncharacterized protein HemY
MAERLASAEFAALVAPMLARLAEEWQADQANINDGVELVRALDVAHFLSASEVADVRKQVRDAILNEARHDCRADELRELLTVLDTSNRANPVVIAAQASFIHFEQHRFSEDLSECRSPEQFDGLIGDLQFFRDELGVDVDRLVERVAEA